MTEEMYNEITTQAMKEGTEVLVFYIEDVLYAIDIKYVVEIIGMQPITQIPKIPEYIKGVINIRGKVVPVMSVRKKFQLEEIEYNERTCIIVVELNDISVGLIVDGVSEVLTVDIGEICHMMDYRKSSKNNYISNVIENKGDNKLLLDIEKLVLE
jgi:purine-binding chemotaxis protein CheW